MWKSLWRLKAKTLQAVQGKRVPALGWEALRSAATTLGPTPVGARDASGLVVPAPTDLCLQAFLPARRERSFLIVPSGNKGIPAVEKTVALPTKGEPA